VSRLVIAARAADRLEVAAGWLAKRPPGEEVLVVGATYEAASELIRRVASDVGTGFGWHRLTLGRLAAELARGELGARGLAPVGALPIEALCARVLQRLRASGELGRLARVADRPGLPRALARTLGELRMAGATEIGDPALDAALRALAAELAGSGLADRADVFAYAAAAVARGGAFVGLPIMLVDVAVRSQLERRLIEDLLARSRDALATVPMGDERTTALIGELFTTRDEGEPEPTELRSLERVQRHLFTGQRPDSSERDDSVEVLSAPGESRECVELARRVLREVERGGAFDRMAIALRSPSQYRVHLEEALGRAGVPVHFEQGTVLPDPSGRAFLALLACAAENLSARRFAEYASIGEVPDLTEEGAPPPSLPAAERWVPPDEELLPSALVRESAAMVEDDTNSAAGALRAPWRWEKLLVEAAVIGGRDRWERRLAGLDAKLRLTDRDEPGGERRARMLDDLAELRRFALPLLDELVALPALASWGDWLGRLGALASRALRRPERVLSVLSALVPMSDVGPASLHEVQLVLQPRLADLVVPPQGRRHGKLLVAPIEAIRGLAFDVVFVPGLAERMFPQKLAEDPLLLDPQRLTSGVDLVTRGDRLADERLQLRLAVGAARQRLVLSYPRIDLDQGRPRVPSFYALEVLEAATGVLPGAGELARAADVTGSARIGWPAPSDRLEAIDEAEHDLALLDGLLRPAGEPLPGTAAYLLAANPHLARSLRFRARRWTVKAWKPADGLIVETERGRAALAAHGLAMRSFSPTALEQLAHCPYRFALRTILKLEPREVPEAIETLGPLERGSLIHEVQFELLCELRDAGLLPVRDLEAVRARVEPVLRRVAARYRDELCPAIDRVWDDGIAAIHADLREWVVQLGEELEWIPHRFELAFGPVRGGAHDAASVADPVMIEVASAGAPLALRGSIDLVERSGTGALRATDYKTGRPTVPVGAVIAGGKSLQPVMYALVLERLFPGSEVAAGRLHYCTSRGGFRSVTVPLDAAARDAARLVADTLAYCFAERFFPAAPDERACAYCDFRPVCGPYEELRAKTKATERLVPLDRLRRAR
jgi:ATP-dependent helicase/nuclease subunit B